MSDKDNSTKTTIAQIDELLSKTRTLIRQTNLALRLNSFSFKQRQDDLDLYEKNNTISLLSEVKQIFIDSIVLIEKSFTTNRQSALQKSEFINQMLRDSLQIDVLKDPDDLNFGRLLNATVLEYFNRKTGEQTND